jgi:hypothetical protein
MSKAVIEFNQGNRLGYNRPVWMWIIFLWFVGAGSYSLCEEFLRLFSNLVVFQEVIAKLMNVESVMRIGFPILVIAASSMLLHGFAFSKWLFYFMFLLSMLNFIRTFLSGVIPVRIEDTWLIMASVQLGLYALLMYSVLAHDRKRIHSKLLSTTIVLTLLLADGVALAIPTPCAQTPNKQPPQKTIDKYRTVTFPIVTQVGPRVLQSVHLAYKQWRLPRFIYDFIAMDLNQDDVRTLVKRPEGFKIDDAGDWLWKPNPEYVAQITDYQDSSRAKAIKCNDDGLTMTGWYLPPALFKDSPLDRYFKRLAIKRSLEEPPFIPLKPIFLLWDKLFPIAKIGGTALKHCVSDFNPVYKDCTFADLEVAQGTEYFVTLLDLETKHVAWLQKIKKEGSELLKDAYNIDPLSDTVEFYFHWPTAAKTTTLHMHMRVNQGRLPTDNARSYELDKVTADLIKHRSSFDIVNDRYNSAGDRLILADKKPEFVEMFGNANATIADVTNEYTPWRDFFEKVKYDPVSGIVTLRRKNNNFPYEINLSAYANKKLTAVYDINGKKLVNNNLNLLKAIDKNIELGNFLSANWPNWDGRGAEYLKPLK